MTEKKYKGTIIGCFAGYVIQSVVNIFVPLLFLTFQNEYNIPLSEITVLITVNFGVQLCVDLLSALFVDKIGYRASVYIAHVMSACGLIFLTFLPGLTSDPFAGLLISVITYAIGGGLLEVLISPMVEACPSDNKPQVMSILHSFYCWGSAGVIIISTAFFALFGIEKWRIITVIWTLFPIANLILFTQVPIATLEDGAEEKPSLKKLLKNKLFWMFMLVMLCAGASENIISQWASAFCESALGVNKSVGDLAGAASFAVLMGIARVLYGKFGKKIDLNMLMAICGFGCVGAYLIASLAQSPVLSLVGVGLSGLFCGIMWPATYSNASEAIKSGGTAMFALFALAGDLGCSSGPTAAGLFADVFGGSLKRGILFTAGFPAVLAIVMLIYALLRRKKLKSLPLVEDKNNFQ